MKRVHGRGPDAWVFSPKDLVDLAGRAAVDQALSRLVRQGRLRRVGRGLYERPRMSRVLGRAAPVDLESAVHAIARRDGLRLMPDGLAAANRLGLTNAVPAKAVYWTDGSSRAVQAGGHTVRFKHVNPVLMQWADRAAAPVVSALVWLGPALAGDAETVAQLRRRLPADVKDDLADGLAQLPTWALPIVRAITGSERRPA